MGSAGCTFAAITRWRSTALYLTEDENGHEVLLVKARLDGHSTLFMVDTAYAGPPVISTSFLSVRDSSFSSVRTRYLRALRAMAQHPRTESVRKRLLQRGRCRAFQSGCTMRLMGIGATEEAQSDLLICPPLGVAPGWSGDILVTNELKGTPHILTVDYLIHNAPCLLNLSTGRLFTRCMWGGLYAFEFHEPTFVGGAPAVHFTVGHSRLLIVLDTGAASTLSLSKTAAMTLQRCDATGAPRSLTQIGVNGERVCSDIIVCPVEVGNIKLGDVDVLINSHPVEGADGYAGMGVLRSFDLWIEPTRIGLRKSSFPVAKATAGVSSNSCGERVSLRCQ